MKTSFVLLAGLAMYLHATVKPSPEYQTATVVSVEQIDTRPAPVVGSNPSDAPLAAREFAYSISLRQSCTLYTARYASATDYLPIYFKPHNNMEVRVEKHWIYVDLPADRELKLSLVGRRTLSGQSCMQ